jgi:hypothetical protein
MNKQASKGPRSRTDLNGSGYPDMELRIKCLPLVGGPYITPGRIPKVAWPAVRPERLTWTYPVSAYSYPMARVRGERPATQGKGGARMHIPGLAQEYERTCEDCGQSWRVPRWAAYPHMQGLPMRRSGLGDSANAVVEANAERAERAASFRNCPKCESDHYKQRAIRS